jgi:hypothetical protein
MAVSHITGDEKEKRLAHMKQQLQKVMKRQYHKEELIETLKYILACTDVNQNKVTQKDQFYEVEQSFDSYDDENNRIYISNSNGEVICVFVIYEDGMTGELYYSRDFGDLLEKILPHPFWYVHGKYLMSDAFNVVFPEYKVFDVRNANIS